MTTATSEKSLQVYARLAGFIYLFGTVLMLGGTLVISSLRVPGDFAATAQSIAASEQLYRASVASVLAGACGTILLAGALYVVLKSVNRNLALFALLWRVAEATFGGITAIIDFIDVENYTGAWSALGADSQQALARLLVAGSNASFHVSIIFFSVGSTIFFSLLFKSRFIPRALAAFGVLATVLAGMLGFATLIVPEQVQALGMIGWAPIFLAEVATGLWLLIAGANLTYWTNRSEFPASTRTS